MKFIHVISIIVAIISIFVTKIQAQDELNDFPISDCEPKIDSDEVEINSVQVNVTFLDGQKSFGPANCDYSFKLSFTTKDPEQLMNYLEFDGVEVLNTKFCNGEKGFKIQPPCKKGQSQQYVLSGIIPKMLIQKQGNVLIKLGFKGENGKKLVCKQNNTYFYKSSSCD